jgi:hypothetical protein
VQDFGNYLEIKRNICLYMIFGEDYCCFKIYTYLLIINILFYCLIESVVWNILISAARIHA